MLYVDSRNMLLFATKKRHKCHQLTPSDGMCNLECFTNDYKIKNLIDHHETNAKKGTWHDIYKYYSMHVYDKAHKTSK